MFVTHVYVHTHAWSCTYKVMGGTISTPDPDRIPFKEGRRRGREHWQAFDELPLAMCVCVCVRPPTCKNKSTSIASSSPLLQSLSSPFLSSSLWPSNVSLLHSPSLYFLSPPRTDQRPMLNLLCKICQSSFFSWSPVFFWQLPKLLLSWCICNCK